ncbi:hypothetical protein HanXRQr2_Chr12g0549771 [Helianthus annuus]|uniref:Uncharacterized protein n=1 Tax=Helianthus annuus TaxID=4232 RepID=A0A251RUL7_HELAN|nr:hypothetical protein HanXRQr2_Chr12g0549771 [Helianthus annuus]
MSATYSTMELVQGHLNVQILEPKRFGASHAFLNQVYTLIHSREHRAMVVELIKPKKYSLIGMKLHKNMLVCTIVVVVILSFSVVITGKITSPATFYATAGGIVAAFLSVFWSFGYIRLSDRLQKTANDPLKVGGSEMEVFLVGVCFQSETR